MGVFNCKLHLKIISDVRHLACMFIEYRDVHGVQECVRMYIEYNLMMIYGTESPQSYLFAMNTLRFI